MVHGSEDVLSKVSASHCSTAFFRHASGNLLSADGRHPLDDHTRFFPAGSRKGRHLYFDGIELTPPSEFKVQAVKVEFLQSPFYLLNCIIFNLPLYLL